MSTTKNTGTSSTTHQWWYFIIRQVLPFTRLIFFLRCLLSLCHAMYLFTKVTREACCYHFFVRIVRFNWHYPQRIDALYRQPLDLVCSAPPISLFLSLLHSMSVSAIFCLAMLNRSTYSHHIHVYDFDLPRVAANVCVRFYFDYRIA